MKLIEQGDIQDINKYPLFFHSVYARYEAGNGWQVLLLQNDERAVIALKTKKGRFITTGQFLYPPVKSGARLSPAEEGIFLSEMIAFCASTNLCDFIMPPLHYSLFQALPAGSYYTGMGILAVDLSPPVEEILKKFSSNYRNEIRKAQAENLSVTFSNDFFPVFYSLYKKTHEKQGIYFDSEGHLKKLIASLTTENCRIVVVKQNETVYGAALILWAGNEGYYFQSGAVEDCPYPGANKLLQLEIMKWLKQTGIKRYCMGGYRLGDDIKGTKYDGIQKFKLRFGANIEKGYHFYVQISWKYGLYKKLLNLYLSIRGIRQNTTGQDYKYN